ncbi:MAG: SusC/RagA family TonB-linked outer membrane protein [Gemmatimonadota bacterium]|nr:SusC/RagA family TonB-linked outer membrane protein [Gemmatimonadota bacterium]
MFPFSRSRLVAGALMFAALGAMPLGAQIATGSISGKITVRSTNQPLADARIVVTGTAVVVFSNARGEFRAPSVPAGLARVTVYKIGYQAVSDSVRVIVGQDATINLSMDVSRVQLSEVVVTGTAGNQERRAQAAVVTSVNAADILRDSPAQNFNEMLQSRVPGVSVSSASGTAGTSRRINIRGASSVNLSNQPLIFIDGIQLIEGQPGLGAGGQSADRLNNLNTDDIESVEVVKGPAAATLYGADASAGVIQIITKKGRAGTSRFRQTLSLQSGQTARLWAPPSNYAFCSASSILPTSTNPLCRGQTTTTLVSDNPLIRENAFRTGNIFNLGYSASGGGQGYGYYLSANRDAQTGTLPNNNFNRQSWRTNFNFVPDPRVTVNANFSLQQSRVQAPDNDNNIYGFLGGGLLGTPLSRTDNGSGSNGWFGVERNVPAISAIQNVLVTRGTTMGLTLNYVPLPWFSHRLTVGGDIEGDETTDYFPKNSRGSYTGLLNTGSNSQSRINNQRYTIDYLANAKRSLWGGNWELNASGGVQYISTKTNFTNVTGTGFVTNANNVPSSASQTSGGGTITDVRQLGYLGQVQLGHLDRRFVQVGLRVDQFSVFGDKVKPALLPKIGGSWVLSDEPFFGNWSNIFDQLRARAAWGQTGRAPGAGASLTTLDAAPSIANGIVESGAVPQNPGNADLKPERGSEIEFGFDAAFLDNRLALEVTYFDKTTNDLILSRPLPPSLGFTQNPQVNIGKVKNSGLEVTLSATPVSTQAVTWDVRGGMSTLKNKLVDLGGVNPFGTLNRFTPGFQLGSWVSKAIRNIDETTGVVTVADTFEVVGNQFPTLEATLSSTVTLWNQLRLTAQFDTKRNFLVQNNTAFFRETQLVRSNARLDTTVLSRRERLRRYGNPTSGQPAFVQENGSGTTVNETRDAFLQPGDFVRFREVGLSWDIPDRWTAMLGPVQTATLGLAVQNVWLWKNKAFTGEDPEVISNAGAQFSRSDFLTMPNPRTTVLRLNLTF